MRDGAEGSNVDERVNPYAPTNFKQNKEKLSEIKQGDVQRQNEEFSMSLHFSHSLQICEIYARSLIETCISTVNLIIFEPFCE